jgi:hypothetical protein
VNDRVLNIVLTTWMACSGPRRQALRGVRPNCRLDAPPLLLDIRGEGIPGQGFPKKKFEQSPGDHPPPTLRATPRELQSCRNQPVASPRSEVPRDPRAPFVGMVAAIIMV